MTLVQLQYFRAICKYNNITKAAEELHVSQPSISNALKDLEEEFGIQLFYRLSKGLSLTEEGRFLLEKTESLLESFESLDRQMRDLSDNKKEIIIGVPPMIGTILFPDIFSQFHQLYPYIRFSIMEYGSVHTRKLVTSGTLDAAIVAFDNRGDEAFKYIKITDAETVFCVSANHPLAEQPYVNIEMIKDEPLVLFKEDSYQAGVAKDLFKSIGAESNVILYSSQLNTIKELVGSNTASTFLFRGVVSQNDGIKCIPFVPPLITEIHLIWNRDKHLYSNLDKLIDFTKNYKQFSPKKNS